MNILSVDHERTRKFPSVELTGEHLTCEQNGELTNVDDQISLLNLLCDMAELAEEMGSDNVKQSDESIVGKEGNGLIRSAEGDNPGTVSKRAEPV